jgi:hypothetical protein
MSKLTIEELKKKLEQQQSLKSDAELLIEKYNEILTKELKKEAKNEATRKLNQQQSLLADAELLIEKYTNEKDEKDKTRAATATTAAPTTAPVPTTVATAATTPEKKVKEKHLELLKQCGFIVEPSK